MSQPYPSYKQSGIEWLGAIPFHWLVGSLKRVSIGKCDGPFGSGLKSDHYTEAGVRVVRLQNITSRGFLDEDAAFIDPVYYATELPGHDVQAGDLLLAGLGDERNTVGRACVAPDHIQPAMVKADCFRFRLDFARAAPAFMAYQLIASAGFDAGMLASGSTRSRISLSLMASRRVVLPPLPEQEAIAVFLDRETGKIDALVEEQRRLIALLKEKRQAVISHAVTRGLDPTAPLKPSGIDWLGDIPAHWELVPLKRVAAIQTGIAKGKEYAGEALIGVPYLRVANVQSGYLDLDDVAIIELPEADVDRYLLRAGDVLMNEGGDFDKLGRGHIWQGEIRRCVHQNHVFAVRPHAVTSEWLAWFTCAEAARFYFMSRSKQSTNLASISSRNLMELPITLPPEDERNEIVNFMGEEVSKLDALISEAETAIALLQERRSALISAAVTGKIDVRGAVPETTEAA